MALSSQLDIFLLLQNLCRHSLIFFGVTALGYLTISGSLYALVFLRPTSKSAPLATKKLKENLSLSTLWASVRHDVVLSLWSSVIFAVCAALMTELYMAGHTRLYLDPAQIGGQYSAWYLAFSLAIAIFLQDTYFYFTHRLAHHPKCYRWMHKGHHHSNNPTPLTAFSFDPAEAFIQAFYLMVAVCVLPMHISVLCAVVLVMSLGALIHHFSIRMFKDSAIGHWLGSWLVGPMHHWFHHRKYTLHYGLYFTFWDKVMGTHCDEYEEILEPPTLEPVLEKAMLAIARMPQNKTARSKTLPFPTPFKKAS
ncbi:MAG: sterol desaturase family protein [Cyanobacteria bacterium J06581_3]